MNKLIKEGSIKLKDKEKIEEHGLLIEEGNKFFGKDKADDLVSAVYWGCYILEMKILDENYNFIKKGKEDDVWGVLSDIETSIEEDWDWLTNSKLYD